MFGQQNLQKSIMFLTHTTPQAKHRFKYLSCINKDYWLIDWLIEELSGVPAQMLLKWC